MVETQHRFVLWSVTGLAALCIAIGGFVWQVTTTRNVADKNADAIQEVKREASIRQFADCQAGNSRSQGIHDFVDLLINVSQQSPNPNDTRSLEERQTLIDDFVRQTREKFPISDCGTRP